jgi:hypothetical protein
MDTPSTSMRELSRRLLAASRSASAPTASEAVLVSDRLRASLTRFAGPDGFTSLLRRALALASAELPPLQCVKVTVDGRLDGWEAFAAESGPGEKSPANVAAVAITGHLLGLLVTFIGEPLTLRLVRDAWPDLALNDSNDRIEADR